MIRITALFFTLFFLCSATFAGQVDTKDSTSTEPVLSDSAKEVRETRRVELLGKLKESSAYIYTHPTSADTLFNPYQINRNTFARDDYFNWTEILRGQGEFVPVFYSPQFHFNRALWRGYTIPLSGRSNSLLTGPATIEQRSASFEPIQVETLTLHSDGTVKPSLFPQTRISPQLFLVMENGLFDGNSLELRVMRNLTRNLSLGIFSSYRDLKRDDFTHFAGGMSGFYRGITALDTANLSFSGRNPLSTNHITTVQMQWKKNATVNVKGHYEDLTNDQIEDYPHFYMGPTSDYDSVWYNRNDYNSTLNASTEIPLSDKVSLELESEMSKRVYRERPLSTQLIHKDSVRNGDQRYLAGGSKISIAPSTSDTFSFRTAANQYVTTHTNSSVSEIFRTDFYGENQYSSPNRPLTIHASAGASFLNRDDSTEFYPCGSIEARITPGSFAFEGWGKYDLVPLVVNYDSLLVPHDGFIGDYFRGTGVRATAAKNKLSFTAGYSLVQAIDSVTIQKYWQSYISPYGNPTNVLTLTPSFGEWHGISLSSSFNIADEKPYLKSTSRLDFHVNKNDRTRHFYTSILLNYWSERDSISYAGRTDWGRPVIDLGTKFTAEIKSFRLFMKMDNILNRNNSYVPGYYMPGLIFRWGFAWTITG